MSGKFLSNLHAKISCNLNDISYLGETQKNNFQFSSLRYEMLGKLNLNYISF